MRVPLGWLREYVDVELSPEQLAERLTLLGMEVKGLERFGADWRNVVVGELLAVERHPRADRLSLTKVTVGTGEPLEIVCGATNIAPGQRVPVALPGAVLPGERRIERTEKMGVVSNGMLCSGDELGLSLDAEGILILPPETPLGAALTDLLGDVVLDVDVKPNRGDALSLLGLAREVAAATGAEVRQPEIALSEIGAPIADLLTVEVRDPVLCSRFVGRRISGVRIGRSPDLVQRRLLAAGMRPISNVVDASNYVMLELGKPTHTFDAAAIHDGRILVRRAEAGERIETIDHIERTLDPDTLVIADRAGVLGIAGVMGGAASEVTDGTTEIVIESAIFDPISIRRTGQRYALRSESSLRFEKGQEFRLARVGADRVAQLINEWAGGEVASGHVDTNPSEPQPSRIAFRPARVNRLLGTKLSLAEQRTLLARVGVDAEPAEARVSVPVSGGPKPLEVEADGTDALVAVVPSWRRDLAIEADIAEEIARVHGYERIPAILPHTPMPAYRPSPLELRESIREVLAGAGLNEVVSHALVPPRHAELLRWPAETGPLVPGDPGAGGMPITVSNPLSSQHSVLRQELAGSLLDLIASNTRHGREDVAIFEIGKGYARDGEGDGGSEAREGGGGRREWWRLCFALTGQANPAAWNQAPRPYDVDDAKGLAELVCRRLGLAAPEYVPDRSGYPFHPGRTARVSAGLGNSGLMPVLPGGTIGSRSRYLSGIVGELHPDLVEAWEIRGGRIILAHLAVAGLAAGQLAAVRAAGVPRFPAVERDIAVVVSVGRPAAEVAATIRRHVGDLLRDVRLFDIYRGAPLGTDEKSLAYRLVFQGPDRTLTEAELDAAVAAVTGGLAAELGAHLRT